MENALYIIIGISVLGPILGSLIGVLKKPSESFMYNLLAFAGGVMLAIAFLELIPESIKMSSILITVIGISFGAVIMYFVDIIIPHIHPGMCKSENCNNLKKGNLKKTSIYLLFGIFLHNFPEGMAIAMGTVSDIRVSIIVAIAIAIHNIPEGICTSAPYYHVSKKKLKSFLISSSTAIPVLIGFFVAKSLYQYLSSEIVGFIIATTAGLMIYITSDELIPSSCCKNTNHKTIFALIIGVLFVVLLGLI
ncbi:ZIP family metal transporter [Candidatus Woesearchaeota archaeon]|nr:ZIP family metal transporter [Candidatus Woesearchaeota archaeon]MCF7901288.1 ZIP family metal transporter [Candidatus Woesearchaeota archaeon]MCF8013771.1 ZIP family metal transporter [Candidatus Woesearchaeota archaeon]